ncbi:protein tonB2 [Ricinus communis]|uniref:protein tonB2 n=1 Tax=Ricinus communis TaxID=3988 RepID=UPI000D69D5A9|nr:protein tonB2 [Ricinus communis]|eukprot:XP_025012962.1 uncharacterized protein LOC112534741 [Ricinus communis]
MTNIKVVHSIHPRLEPAPHLIEPQVGVPRATPPPPVPGTTPPPPTPLPVVGVVPVVGVRDKNKIKPDDPVKRRNKETQSRPRKTCKRVILA